MTKAAAWLTNWWNRRARRRDYESTSKQLQRLLEVAKIRVNLSENRLVEASQRFERSKAQLDLEASRLEEALAAAHQEVRAQKDALDAAEEHSKIQQMIVDATETGFLRMLTMRDAEIAEAKRRELFAEAPIHREEIA